jgi:F-type H+-transporting ATPase subunit gamma
MALYTRAIKTKIRSVGNIRKITRAMEMVAVSKMRKAVGKTLATRPFAMHARELLLALENGGGEAKHPLLMRGAGEETLVVVFASDKGLCGGFNVVLGKAIARFVVQEGGRDRVAFVTIGRYAERMCRRFGSVVASFVDLNAEESYQMATLSRLIEEEYRSGKYRRVVLAYNDYISAVSFRPTLRVLLPIGKDNLTEALAGIGGQASFSAEPQATPRYLFEPSREQLLDEIVAQLIEVILFQAFLESAASESSARMVAMKNATDNATELLDSLTLSYNHARQDGITQELSEIAAGTMAN